ncbi:MAG: M23 family metallopeptidase [Alphaproteobacteria bacterium]|nr:M23 family metallopeptidase [Alphaproteobacteria bacterium]
MKKRVNKTIPRLKKALIIGGIAAIGYLALKGIGKNRQKDRDKNKIELVTFDSLDADQWENPKDIAMTWSTGFGDIRRGYQSGYGCLFATRGTNRWHCGIDKNCGKAETDGTVVFVRKHRTSDENTYVVLQKSNQKLAVYLHLERSSITLKNGDKINKGDFIGKPAKVGKTPAHIHYVVLNTEKVPADIEQTGKYMPWQDRFIDPAETLADIVANRPGLEREILYSPEFLFVAKYLKAKGARRVMQNVIANRTFNIDNILVREAASAWQIAQTPVVLRPGFINPGTGSIVFEAQMQRLEPVLGNIAVSKEGVFEIGYFDPDVKRVTGAAGIQNMTPNGPIQAGQLVPGFDGRFGLTDQEKEYAYQYVIWKYRKEFYPQIRKYITRELTDGQAVVVCELAFRFGEAWALNSDGTRTKLLEAINADDDNEVIRQLSRWRFAENPKTKKKETAGGLIMRNGFLSALWMGDVTPGELLDMQSGALYNYYGTIKPVRYPFYEQTVEAINAMDRNIGINNPSRPLTYKFDRREWEKVKEYKYSNTRAAFDNGQGARNAKGGNIDLNRNMIPGWVVAELEKTKDGWPEKDDVERNNWLQEIADEWGQSMWDFTSVRQTDSEAAGDKGYEYSQDEVAPVSEKDRKKAISHANKAIAELDKYIEKGDPKNWWGKIFGTTSDDPGKRARKAIALDPDNNFAKMVLVWEAVSAGQDSLAVRLASEVTDDTDFYVSVDSIANRVLARTLWYAGQSYEKLGYPYKAYVDFSEAQARMPSLGLDNDIVRLHGLAMQIPGVLAEAIALRSQNNTDGSIRKAREFIYGENVEKHAPQHLESAYILMAELRAGEKDYRRAYGNYKIAFELSNPRNPEYILAAAEYAILAKEYDLSVEFSGFARHGNYVSEIQAKGWAFAGKARENQGQKQKAFVNFRKANELHQIYGADVERLRGAVNPPVQKHEYLKRVEGLSKVTGKHEEIIEYLANGSKIRKRNVQDDNQRGELWFYYAEAMRVRAERERNRDRRIRYFQQSYNAYVQSWQESKNSSKAQEAKRKGEELIRDGKAKRKSGRSDFVSYNEPSVHLLQKKSTWNISAAQLQLSVNNIKQLKNRAMGRQHQRMG